MKIELYNADCLEELPKINKRLGGKFIIVTDPPFNIGYHYSNYKRNFIGIELDENYFKIAEHRINNTMETLL